MATKREQEEEARKARLLALVGEGAAHYKKTHDVPAEPEPPAPAATAPVPREAVVPPPAPITPKPPVLPKKPKAEPPPPVDQAEEPPAPLGPEHEDPSEYLVKRRRSLRDDPNWIGTTLYLRRSTHAALVEACRGAGLDMSRVVQFCVALQMDEKQRSPVLSQLLGE